MPARDRPHHEAWGALGTWALGGGAHRSETWCGQDSAHVLRALCFLGSTHAILSDATDWSTARVVCGIVCTLEVCSGAAPLGWVGRGQIAWGTCWQSSLAFLAGQAVVVRSGAECPVGVSMQACVAAVACFAPCASARLPGRCPSSARVAPHPPPVLNSSQFLTGIYSSPAPSLVPNFFPIST